MSWQRVVIRRLVGLLAAMPCAVLFTGCQQPAREVAGGPTYYRDVAPILLKHCVACHRPDTAAPFSLLSYEQARERAPQIGKVTQSRYMPPWLPDEGRYAFLGDCRLSDSQIATIQQWIAAGSPSGDPAAAPPVPQWKKGWYLGQPDLVVHSNTNFVVPADGPDIWRQFVISVPLTKPRSMCGRSRFVPATNARCITRSCASTRRESRGGWPRESADGGLDVLSAREVHNPAGHALNWLPGLIPFAEDPAMAWRLDPGTDLVVETHLLPSGKPEPLQISVGLYFTDVPPSQFPVELLLHSGTIDIPAGDSDYETTDSYVLPMDVQLLGLLPHAHLLGKTFDVEARLPDGREQNLLHIPRWDFNWQNAYRFVTPVALPQGTTVSMRICYDNSAQNPRNPHVPPERVQFGYQTSQEMGQATLQLLPASEDASRELTADIMRHELTTTIASHEFRLANHPDDAAGASGTGQGLAA